MVRRKLQLHYYHPFFWEFGLAEMTRPLITQCKNKCGLEFESRQAQCVSPKGTVYPDEFCHAYRRPALNRTCAEATKCKHVWFASQWSEVISCLFFLQSPAAVKHNDDNLVSFSCSARLIVGLEFRPGGCFAEQWMVRHPLKSMMKTAILPNDTRTQLNATCRPRSARAPGFLDLGVRYLTLFFCLLFTNLVGCFGNSRERDKRGLMYFFLSLIFVSGNSAQRLAVLEAGRDQFCALLIM